MRTIFLTLLLLILTSPAFSESILTAVCEEPGGVRFDFVNGKINTSPDGFSGVNPSFIVIKDKPKKLIVIWGAAKIGDIQPPANAKEVDIVSITKNQITALEVAPTGDAVIMYSVYPQKGIVYMTQHRYLTIGGTDSSGTPNNASYYCKCTVSMK